MKLATIIHMAWLCLAIYPLHQDSILNQKVSLSYRDAPITEIIQNIQREYEVRFSYLNNEIPEDIKVTINLENQPLYLALDKIFEETMISYQVVSGQVILKKNLQKVKKESTPEEEKQETKVSSQGSVHNRATPPAPGYTAENEEADSLAEANDNTASVSISKQPQVISTIPTEKVKPNQKEAHEIPEKSLENSANTQNNRPDIPTNKKREKTNLGRRFERVGIGLRKLFQKMPGEDENDYERKSFQFGLIYPLSTNGTQAGKYVNEFSLNLLVGYAAGLDGVEFSGFGNIENDFVRGAQFAGFFNVVKNDVDGAQFAGFANVNGGNMKGGQFAGFINTAAGEVEGIQASGFMNMSTGYTKGAQLSGFMNVVTDNAQALQAAGFGNFTSGDMSGGQLSGFINYSHDANVQLAGFMNVASGDVEGFQGSGFINLARNVKGAQLGVFNVADSVDGIPIGFLSIVRKNGYRRLEVWGSETLHANVGFKIGVEKFYNIFAFGSQFAAESLRWGFGYGVGTQLNLSSRDHLNIDLMSFQVEEDGDRVFENTELNLLNTLRIAYNHQFSEHFGIFVAPTFNVMVSQRRNDIDGSIGTDLAPWTVFDRTYSGTNLQMWPGFHLGLRF
ncbi:hypothetical protein OKW21_000071 [Catalinimonas alkaloidigena]|uniref:DUF4974 domain-containing protein n=1 Tax=Catalinimonas alkaloidigena TaxID=1075417 RepID=UPI002404DAD6|nr:DUF4974 domain-containing protein [Catalinimonas alkaloidigena]MDF9794808.1 hypothetical protein [Catalinimonas alkaloidigena]